MPIRIFPDAVLAVTPAPGWAWKSENRIERELPTRCFLHRQPGQRMFAALLRAGRQAHQLFRGLTSVKQITSPSSSFASVIVPVLSKAKADTLASRSSAAPLLMRTPVPANRPSAAMTAAGVARINAHGQATTSTDSVG